MLNGRNPLELFKSKQGSAELSIKERVDILKTKNFQSDLPLANNLDPTLDSRPSFYSSFKRVSSLSSIEKRDDVLPASSARKPKEDRVDIVNLIH